MDKWIRNKSDEIARDQGCYFDIAAADRVRFFFARFLRHSKGQWAGKPFELLDWQWENVIAPAHGWKRPDGTRRFRRVGIAIPKKNGKSTLLAAESIYMTCGDGEPGAEVYSAAADRDQASIIYNEAVAMVEASKALRERLRIVRSGRRILYPRAKSIYKALSADVPTKEGLNIHCLLFDELHAQKNWNLYNALKYGGAARRQPLLFWITTAGVDKESVCYSQWQYAKKVQESEIVDVDFLPYICEVSEKEDWTREEVWRKVNPSYGITLSSRDFQADCTEARQTPMAENNFKRYRLNMWTAQVTKWISLDRWNQCTADFDLQSLAKQRCVIGLDLATTTDLAAAAILFKRADGYRVLPLFWVPEQTVEKRRRENQTRLEMWIEEGLIKVTEGDVIDYNVIRQDLNDLADVVKVDKLAVDPWNATQIATDLQGDGFDVEYVRTGFASISAATKEFEKLVLGKQLLHNGNPVLAWNLGNIAVETDASGNIKPSKKKSAEKIDGIVAIILALALYIKAPGKKRSKYEDKGLSCL